MHCSGGLGIMPSPKSAQPEASFHSERISAPEEAGGRSDHPFLPCTCASQFSVWL